MLPYDNQVVDTVTSFTASENQPELVKGNDIFGFSIDKIIDKNDMEDGERNVAEENSNADPVVVQNEVRAV